MLFELSYEQRVPSIKLSSVLYISLVSLPTHISLHFSSSNILVLINNKAKERE